MENNYKQILKIMTPENNAKLASLKETMELAGKERFANEGNESHEAWLKALKEYEEFFIQCAINVDEVPTADQIREWPIEGYPTHEYRTIGDDRRGNMLTFKNGQVLRFKSSHTQELTFNKILRTFKLEKIVPEMSWERWMST